MQSGNTSTRGASDAAMPRMVLVVDGSNGDGEALRDAWLRFRFLDELHVVSRPEHGLPLLEGSARNSGRARIAAVVLDPELTGEDTGAFLRAARRAFRRDHARILLWSRAADMYKVLEGRGVDAVVAKPMVLRLIGEIETLCGLPARQSRWLPYSSWDTLNPAQRKAAATSSARSLRPVTGDPLVAAAE